MTTPEGIDSPVEPKPTPPSFLLRPPKRRLFEDEPMFERPAPDASARTRRFEDLKAETWPDGPPPLPWWWDKKSREQVAAAAAALLVGRR